MERVFEKEKKMENKKDHTQEYLSNKNTKLFDLPIEIIEIEIFKKYLLYFLRNLACVSKQSLQIVNKIKQGRDFDDKKH